MKRNATSREVDGLVRACVRGSHGNMLAAWLAASELDDDVRRAVVRRVEKLADKCEVVGDDVPAARSYEWVDGSRRARVATTRW